MLKYYQVLNNAWKKEVKEAATIAITALAEVPKDQRPDKKLLNSIIQVINSNLTEDFRAAVEKDTKIFIEKSVKLGLTDASTQAQKFGVSIGLYGIQEMKLTNIIAKQNNFWVSQHWSHDLAGKFKQSISESIEKGYTRQQLATQMQSQFADLNKSSAYWQGFAEHTALRIREFGRLQGYQKAGAKFYRLVVIMDDRTSPICRALHAQNKLYPLDEALSTMNALLSLNPDTMSLDKMKEKTKQIAPWVNEKDIQYDNDKPVGISAAHTPFPPFHWKCRTTTEIVL